MHDFQYFIEAKNNNEMVQFFEKRAAGAAKIASEARAKGGPSILTAWHFAAKAKPYAEVLQAIKANKPESFYMSKCKSLMSSVRCGGMTQKSFQEVMGRLEVMGEAIAQLFPR